MKYSRFDEQTAMYDVFEDSRTHALNADLPLPKLASAVNGIGVAARDAGRRLPSGARHVGQSWHAVGLVVPSTQSGSSGFGGIDMDDVPVGWIGAGAVLGAIVGLTKDNSAGGAVAGGLVGFLGYAIWRRQ